MIIDTDVLIWYLRGDEGARETVEEAVPFSISVITYMELVQEMRNKPESRAFQKQIQKWNVEIVQISREASSRAMFYVQEYALSHSMRLADALIAATVVQSGELLLTANDRHYTFIPTMECKRFKPAKSRPTRPAGDPGSSEQARVLDEHAKSLRSRGDGGREGRETR